MLKFRIIYAALKPCIIMPVAWLSNTIALRRLTHIRNRFRLAFGACRCYQVIYSVYQNAISPGYSIIELIRRYPGESCLATQPKRNCIFNDFPFWDFGRTVYLSANWSRADFSGNENVRWFILFTESMIIAYKQSVGARNAYQLPTINKCMRS